MCVCEIGASEVMGSYLTPKNGTILWCSITSACAQSVNPHQFSLITQQNSAAKLHLQKSIFYWAKGIMHRSLRRVSISVKFLTVLDGTSCP